MADKLIISTSTNYHWVRKIAASSYDGLALKLTIGGNPDASDCQSNEAEINLFFEDDCRELVERLIAAINGAAYVASKVEADLVA
jgi:hypothetical protein